MDTHTTLDSPDAVLAEHEDARTRQEILAAYAGLQRDAAAWADYLAELEEWDGLPRKTSDLPTTITGSASGPSAAR